MRAKAGGDVQYRNVFHAGYVIVKAHGIRGAYQGLSATICRNIPACAAYFCKLLYSKFLNDFADYFRKYYRYNLNDEHFLYDQGNVHVIKRNTVCIILNII